jgi:two-component system cell cycle response regulator CtrA
MEYVYRARVEKPEPKIVDVLVCKIRKKLANASDGNDYLDTVWGRGYLLRKEPVKPVRAAALTFDLSHPA